MDYIMCVVQKSVVYTSNLMNECFSFHNEEDMDVQA